jgi:serine/threonine protein phosphatase PrpC
MSSGNWIQVTAFTHHGRIRAANEDAIVVGKWLRSTPMQMPEQWRYNLGDPLICAVADGMGGHSAGEVASRYTVCRLSEQSHQIKDKNAAISVLKGINLELYDAMTNDPASQGMGTTVVGVMLIERELLWFNIGDSRLYRHRNGFLRQISVDDVLDAPRDQNQSNRRESHAITQSLGGSFSFRGIVPHAGCFDLPMPSRWLLCSDGLTDMIDIDALEACMAAADLEATQKLFELAMAAGGEDNISIMVLSVGAGAAHPPG